MFTVLLTTNERDADAVNNRKVNENDKKHRIRGAWIIFIG